MKLAEGVGVFSAPGVGSPNALLLRSPNSLSLKLGRYLGSKSIICSKKIWAIYLGLGIRSDTVFSVFMLHLGQLNCDFLGHCHPAKTEVQIIVTTRYAADAAFLGAANFTGFGTVNKTA